MNTRTAVLEALFEESATVRQLVTRTGRSESGVRRALVALSDQNLVDETYVQADMCGERGVHGLSVMWFATHEPIGSPGMDASTDAMEWCRDHAERVRALCPPDPADDPDGARRSDSSMKSDTQ